MYDKYTKSGIFAAMNYPFSWLQGDANSSRNLKGKLVLTAFRDKPGQTPFLTNSVLGGTKTLTYGYDAMNRLTSVKNGSSTVESFQYDYDGNISQRSYLSGGVLNNLYFAPSGNRISSVFTDRDEFNYYYDNRGNVTTDQSSDISNITYDHRNLPLSITKSSVTSMYRYDDGGNRIYKDAQGKKEYYFRDDLGHEFAVFDASTDKIKTINLFGNDLIGRIDRTWEIEYDPVWDEWTGYSYDNSFYYVKDHLGSIRQTLSTSGAVQSAQDYYAFGGTLSSYVNGSTVDKYKFTAKERDTETGLDYFGARYYDSKICRWMSVDPLADRYPSLSPYNYCGNNPLMLTDPNGMWPFYYHDRLIMEAFGTSFDKNTLQRLIDASYWADRGTGTYRTVDGTKITGSFQAAEFSFIHAMKNTKTGNIPNNQALAEIDKWLQGKQFSDPVLDFGMKLHTIMDLTCNEHYLKSWDGDIWKSYVKSGHMVGEVIFGDEIDLMATTVATTRLMNLFRQDYDAGKVKSASEYRRIYNGYYYDASKGWANYDPQFQ
ncbi:MAG TPA: RHS repeat-associated core domain-containing protein [Ignavibacteriales bacterium]|nr:RHS repeat-associated core domain-containing protein [Ignavibacteriales bacterium]